MGVADTEWCARSFCQVICLQVQTLLQGHTGFTLPCIADENVSTEHKVQAMAQLAIKAPACVPQSTRTRFPLLALRMCNAADVHDFCQIDLFRGFAVWFLL